MEVKKMLPLGSPTLEIHLDVSNSCNCFQWCRLFRRRREDTNVLMYVTKDGRAERFDPQKAHDADEAIMKSVKNLQKYIEAVAIWHEKSINELKDKIEKDAGFCCASKEPPRVTLGLIQKINQAIEGFFNPEPPPTSSKS